MMMNDSRNSTSGNDLTVNGLLLILRRRRKIIARTTGVCFLLGLLVCVFMTRSYESTGEIQLQKQSTNGLVGENGITNTADAAADAMEANIAMQTQANILQSDSLALKVIENLNLENTKDFRPMWNPIGWALGLISPNGPKDRPGVSLENAPKRRAHALKVFEKHLKVKSIAGTRLIDVTYRSSDRNTAADVVNQLTKGLVDYNVQTRYEATNQASEWLGGQMATLKKQAEDLQAKVDQLQNAAGVYSLGTTDATGHDQTYSATLDNLQHATDALTAATSNRILKGALYQMVRNGDPELISGLAGSSLSGATPAVNNAFNLLQNLRTQQATLRAQVSNDSSKYGSANPRLADEQASLTSIDNAVEQEVKRIGERASNDYRAAQVTEAETRRVYDQERLMAAQMNDKATQYTIARQEATDSRQLYDTLYQRLKEAGVMQGLHLANIAVVDPGRVPDKPARPNVPLYLAASIIAGLFLGVCGALYADIVDEKIQSIEFVEHELQMHLVGILPKLLDRPGSRLAVRRPTQKLLETSAHPALPVIANPNSPFAEAVRTLRTALQLLGEKNDACKVILITSAVPQEGKSTISANLAALLAQSDQRVLLMECDMRRPSFGSQFGLPSDSQSGLSAVLTGNQSALTGEEEDVHKISGFKLLQAGPIPRHPSELLSAKRMHSLLEELKPKFDYIVLDSPPVLAVTDATILSRLADVTLLIARHGLTPRKSLKRAYQLLTANDATKVGIVLNGVDRNSASYDEYYGYSGTTYYQTEGEVLHA